MYIYIVYGTHSEDFVKMQKSRLDRLMMAKTDIISFFNEQPKSIFLYSELRRIVSEQREHWSLTASTTLDNFLKFALENTRLQEARVAFPYRPVVRYTWGEIPIFELVLSLQSDSYLSHYTAMYLHDLTEQIPKTIYLNFEQRPKNYEVKPLEQSRIDAAFRRPMRTSKNIATFKDYRICLLNSMGIGNLGVIESRWTDGEKIRFTSIEKTLIDITVRPIYAGGVFEVLKAYRSAKGNVSINRLTAMLRKLNYVYPYHQAVGFYLERSGVYDESSIRLLRKFEMNYDFYLTYDMQEQDYSKEWRLFFPKGF